MDNHTMIRQHEVPFDHAGGYIQIEVSGTGKAQMQVQSGEPGTWINCGDALAQNTYSDVFQPGKYRFQLNNVSVSTR